MRAMLCRALHIQASGMAPAGAGGGGGAAPRGAGLVIAVVGGMLAQWLKMQARSPPKDG